MTLSPLRTNEDVPGTLRMPLQITREETRRYCFTDDNAEPHTARLYDLSNNLLFTIVADSECREAKFPIGEYVLRVSHAHPEDVDPTPDTIHGRLTFNATSQIEYTLTSNGCPSCVIDHPFPALGDTGQYGFTGNYFGAILRSNCVHDGTNACLLDGTFDNADLDIDAPQSLTARGSYAGTDWTGTNLGYAATSDSLIRFDGNFRYSIAAMTLRPGPVQPKVEFAAGTQFPDYLAVHRWLDAGLSRTQISGRVRVYGPKTSGGALLCSATTLDVGLFDIAWFCGTPDRISLAFNGCTIINGPIRCQATPIAFQGSLANTTFVGGSWNIATTSVFGGSTFVDATVAVEQPRTSLPASGNISGVTFLRSTVGYRGPPPDPALPAFIADRVTLIDSTFSNVSLAGSSWKGAQLLSGSFVNNDVSNSEWDGAQFGSAPQAGNPTSVDLSGSNFSKASLKNLTFLRADADSTSFADATISFAKATESILNPIFLNAPNSNWTRANLASPRGVVIANNSKWTNAIVTSAQLVSPSTFADSALYDAQFLGTTHLSGLSFAAAVLQRATFSQLDAAGANFSNADLRSVNFNGAKLDGRSRFQGAILCGSQLANVHLESAFLTNAWTGSLPLASPRAPSCTQAQGLPTAATTNDTICPDGQTGACQPGHWGPSAQLFNCGFDKPVGVTCSLWCECDSQFCNSRGRCGGQKP